jgi:hypothetical protein
MSGRKDTDGGATDAIELHGDPAADNDAADAKLGNEYDQRGMVRMGKRQELRREFQFFSIWGFAVMYVVATTAGGLEY